MAEDVLVKGVKRGEAKGWMLDIMRCIDALPGKEFSLKEMVGDESELGRGNIRGKGRRVAGTEEPKGMWSLWEMEPTE